MSDRVADLGNRLFPLVQALYSDVATAGKLTGMLMDAMPHAEIEKLLPNPDGLKQLLSEAHKALNSSSATSESASSPVPDLPAASDGSEAVEAINSEHKPKSVDETGAEAEGETVTQPDPEPEPEPEARRPSGPKELLTAIKWHPGITFADIFVDFRKRKSSGKLSKRVTGSPFIAFSFSQLDKVDDEQIEQVLWRNTPIFQKKNIENPMQELDVEALGLTAPADLEQAAMVNGLLTGQKPSRASAVEKVASGQAKMEPIPQKARDERDEAADRAALLDHLAANAVDPGDITLVAEALTKYYTEEKMKRSAESVSTWADQIDQYCWKDGATRFVFHAAGDGDSMLYKSTAYGKSGFGLRLLGREYVNIFIQHRYYPHIGNVWTLAFHDLESGSRLEGKLVNPGLPREGRSATGKKSSSEDLTDDCWKFEVWATTNFPPGKISKRLVNACKTLPGNYLVQVGKPE